MNKKLNELSPEEMLQMAIEVEHRLEARLRTFGELYSTDTKVHDVFERLAGEEVQHRKMLEAAWDRLFGEDAVRPSMSDSEVTKIITAHDESDVDEDLHVNEAMDAVVAAERQAGDFYERAALSTEHAELRELFLKLGEMEKEHCHAVQDQLRIE